LAAVRSCLLAATKQTRLSVRSRTGGRRG